MDLGNEPSLIDEANQQESSILVDKSNAFQAWTKNDGRMYLRVARFGQVEIDLMLKGSLDLLDDSFGDLVR